MKSSLSKFKSVNQRCIDQWKELTRIRNAEVRGSIPLCSTNRINYLRQGGHPAFFNWHRFVTWQNGLHQVFNSSAFRLIGRVSVAQSHSNIGPSKDFSQCERIGSAIGHATGRGVTQVMKPKVPDSCPLLTAYDRAHSVLGMPRPPSSYRVHNL